MTEFEERLTHEYSKLAEQDAQEQKKHAEWIGELGVRVTTLTDASNRVTSELNELFH